MESFQDNNEEEKIDKRILYTKMVLKDALLNELKKKPYEKIGIVKLCDVAQISRSAFYLHYDCLDDLLREIIEEALEKEPMIIRHILGDFGTGSIKEPERAKEHTIYDIEPEKYNTLIHEFKAQKIIMSYISEKYKEKYIEDLINAKGIGRKEAELFFCFQMAGFLAVADREGEDSFKTIKKIRAMIDAFTVNAQVFS